MRDDFNIDESELVQILKNMNIVASQETITTTPDPEYNMIRPSCDLFNQEQENEKNKLKRKVGTPKNTHNNQTPLPIIQQKTDSAFFYCKAVIAIETDVSIEPSPTTPLKKKQRT